MERHASESTLQPGDTFGRYVVVRLVGSGGVGQVYEAQHTGLKKRVALKTLHRKALDQKHVLARFLREGEAAARIRHSHVVDVTDVGVENGVPYLVMEYLEGHDLRRAMAQGPMPVTEIAALMIPVIAGVSEAHRCKVVHRDLKPENVFLARQTDGSMKPVVVDFGLSRVLDDNESSRLTATASFMGTPLYMSPEQARGAKDVDVRSDQFALGVILYEMFTGIRPFGGENILEIVHNISSVSAVAPSAVRPGLPVDLDEPILRALAKDPAERHASVGVLAAALLRHGDERTRAVWEPQSGQIELASASNAKPAGADEGADVEFQSAASSTLEHAVRVVATGAPPSRTRWTTWVGVAGGVLLALAVGGAAIVGWAGPGTIPARGPAAPPADPQERRLVQPPEPRVVVPTQHAITQAPAAAALLNDAGVDARDLGAPVAARRPRVTRPGARTVIPISPPPQKTRTGRNQAPIID